MRTDVLSPQPEIDVRPMRVFRVENFPDSAEAYWLNRSDLRERIPALHAAGVLTDQERGWRTQWAEHGYYTHYVEFRIKENRRVR
jgi:hypothetical protein